MLSSFDYQYSHAPRDAGGLRSERGELLDRVRITGEHTYYGYVQGYAIFLMTGNKEKPL